MTRQDRKALEELLLSAADEGWDPDGPEIAAAFGDDAEGLAAARDWLRTHAAYDELADDEHAFVEEICRNPVDDADRNLVEGFFRERSEPRPEPHLRPSFPPWQLVAGLLLLIGAGFWIGSAATETAPSPGGDAGDEGLFLGSAPLEGLAPAGPGSSFESFRWDPIELPPGGSYRVIVESQGREILRASGLKEASLEATPAQRAKLEACEEIDWRVYALGADTQGAPIAFGSATASRR